MSGRYARRAMIASSDRRGLGGTASPPPRDLQRFLDALHVAFDDATAADPARRVLVDGLFASLDRPRTLAPIEGTRLPVCRHLGRAMANVERRAKAGADDTAAARASSASTATLARALAALEPSFAWYRRIDSDSHGRTFHDGHANAFVVGPGGIEDAPGPAVGISLVAPGVRYPDHHHPPEELYLVLSSGHWRHGDSSWFEPGIGGVVHNTPHIVHAMRSDDEPLLAIWCLLD